MRRKGGAAESATKLAIKSFITMEYIIRAVKYFFYYTIIFFLVIAIVFQFSEHPGVETLQEFFQVSFQEGAGVKIFLLFLAFGLIYPLLGFSKKEIYTNNDFGQKRKEIDGLFISAHYVLKSDDGKKMVWVLRNPVMRAFRVYEDKVTIDYSSNPVIISGLRKDVFRFGRGIEYIMQKESL